MSENSKWPLGVPGLYVAVQTGRAPNEIAVIRGCSRPFSSLEIGTAVHAALSAPIKPHPIVKLAASLVDELTEDEISARAALKQLSHRWAAKIRPPLRVAHLLRSKGALWRMKGIGAC